MPMNKLLWFWGALLLFFAVPFPCLLYFATAWPVGPGARVAPWWALTLLATSLALWLWLLYAYLDKLLLGPLRALQHVQRVLRHGASRNAEVEQAERTGVQVRGLAQWRVVLGFDNLSGTRISDTLVLVDRKPTQRRFEVGKTHAVRVSTEPGAYPNVVLEGAQPELNRGSLWLRGLIGALLLALVGAAYVAAWRAQSQGLGWTFLSFGHPLLVCPLILCGCLLGLRVLARALRMDAKSETVKYRGIRTVARILDVRQTGTYLNEQPQVAFHLAFEDAQGRTHEVSVRRFVPLIELSQLPRERVSLLYDPQDPQQVRMEDA
jgi:hypothetical protein